MLSRGCHAPSTLYMPAPTGALLNASLPPAAATAVGDTIMPGRSDSWTSSGMYCGALSSTSTVFGSTTSTPVTIGRRPVIVDSGSVIARVMLNRTASASSGVPSWNVTPLRKVKRTRSGCCSHDSARRGMISDVIGSVATSVS